MGKESFRKAEKTQISPATLNPNGFRQYQFAIKMFGDLARNNRGRTNSYDAGLLYGLIQALTTKQQKRIDYHHVGLSHEALLETFDRLDGIVRKVAAEKGVMLIDASAHLSGKVWAFDDHVHVVPKGSEALAQFVADYLQSILRK